MPAKKSDKRTFTIQASEIGFTGGNYASDLPSKAGKKAAKRLFQLVTKDASFKRFASLKTIKFILREKTQGSAKNTFFYEAEMKKLATPKYITVKAPNAEGADENGYVKYPVTKEIKVAACEESHVAHLSKK
jgi:hypothetical protein